LFFQSAGISDLIDDLFVAALFCVGPGFEFCANELSIDYSRAEFGLLF